MKKQTSILIGIVWLCACSAMAQEPVNVPVAQAKQAELKTWKTYTVDGEHFSVSLPTVPAMTTENTLIRPMKTRRTRMLGGYADGAVYGVWVYENVNRQSLGDFIAEENRRDDWDISTETAVTINGVNGKQYAARDKNRPSIAQFFASEGRLYKFSVGGDGVEGDGAKQFFSSIALGKDIDGIKVKDGPGLPFEHPAAEQVVTGKDVNRRARVYQKPEPRYTESARQDQTTGTVVLRAVFSSSGTVTDIRVVKELPNGLTEKAIEALKRLKFCPAVKDGKYASVWMQLEYNFNLY
jgi:TonB family protein